MLVDFAIANYRSIQDEQTLSLSATSLKEHPHAVFHTWEKIPLLKVAVIYGANGSGKSNLMEAMAEMSRFIKNATDLKLGDSIPYYKPFKLDRLSAYSPTRCEIEFVASDEVRYRYAFAFTATEVVEESLYAYPKKQEARLFLRKKGERMEFGDSLKGAKKQIESQLLANQLFLSRAANSNHEQLGRLYKELTSLIFIDTSQTEELVRQTSQYLLRHPSSDFIARMGELLNRADTGVEQIQLKSVQPMQPHSAEREFQPFTIHSIYEGGEKVGDTTFSMNEESRGTRQVYGLAGLLFHALEHGKTICIDELDISFHPLMTEMLVKLFYDKTANPKGAQLIFSTHDTSMLSHRLFRRDQVWFAEKNGYGATSIFSLSEFDFNQVRANIPFDKWYLSGRFGALPLIKDFGFEEEALDLEAEMGSKPNMA